MNRVSLTPRKDWIKKVEEVGLIYHHTFEGVYWDESAYWELRMDQVEQLEKATHELHQLALRAAQHVIDTKRYHDFAIPNWCIPLIEQCWYSEPPALYGRMDLAYDGVGAPKLLEYNADTPTGLVEAAVAQWYWLQELFPGADQFNSLHEKLVEKWKDLSAWSPVHFAHVNQSEGEDLMTVTYLRETAQQAGLQTHGLAITDIGWDGDNFVDLDGNVINTMFKLYPWEWLVHESFGKYIAENKTTWIEPIWKMLLSNKALLPIMWELEPDHPNLLPTYFAKEFSGLSGAAQRVLGSCVRKPLLSREGANITLFDGAHTETQPGEYGSEGYIFQTIASLPENHAIVGSWMIDQSPAGIGIREPKLGSRITTNVSRFVPHRIV